MAGFHSSRRYLMLLLGGVAALSALGDAPRGAELSSATALIMIEDAGCPYCARFDAEVRDGYVKSPEGTFAPLVRRPRRAADVAFLKGIVYSPTFVLLVEGREVGRIVGYQGSELFWMELAGLMQKAGFQAPKSSPGTG